MYGKEINNVPRGPLQEDSSPRRHRGRKAIRATLAIQITLLMTEIWEQICDEGFESESSETLVDLFVKHGLAERIEATEEDKKYWDVDFKHQLKLDMAAVRGKVKKYEQRKKGDLGRK